MPRRSPAKSPVLIQTSKSPSVTTAEGDLTYLGLGLRSRHLQEVQAKGYRASTPVRWFEMITENLMDAGTGHRQPGRQACDLIREDFEFALHGTCLSLGGTDPFSRTYMRELLELVRRYEPFVVSDHLCFSGVGGAHGHDLFPVPFRESVLRHLVSRIQYVQEFLGRPIAVENVSSYVEYTGKDWSPEYTEWGFLKELSARSGCKILLDVNNIYVNSVNHGFDPETYLLGLESSSIVQIHIAGHTPDETGYLIDTHVGPVPNAVWDWYAEAIRVHGARPTLLEWDNEIPSLRRLEREVCRALPALREGVRSQESVPVAREISRRTREAISSAEAVS